MKIIGKFNDIYDSIVYQYGIDNQVIFDRSKYSNIPDAEFEVKRPKVFNLWMYRKKYNDYYNEMDSLHDSIQKNEKSVVGFYIDNTIYFLITDGQIPNDHSKFIHYKNKFDLLKDQNGDTYKQAATNSLIEFSKLHNLPYFAFVAHFGLLNSYYIKTYFSISNINNFTNEFDIVKLYQYTENFLLTNKIEPIASQSNENKIESSGFDLKSSFRHR